jgi:hypothetical protein
MILKIGKLLSHAKKGYDSDAQVYFDNIVSNGGSISKSSKAYVNNFVVSLKTAGIWNSLYEIYPFMGDQLSAALVKLKATSSPSNFVNHGFVSGDYTETGASGGLKGNGLTKYLDSGFLNTLLPFDNTSIGCYQNVLPPNGTNAWFCRSRRYSLRCIKHLRFRL